MTPILHKLIQEIEGTLFSLFFVFIIALVLKPGKDILHKNKTSIAHKNKALLHKNKTFMIQIYSSLSKY